MDRVARARVELERVETLLEKQPGEDAACLLCLVKSARRECASHEAGNESLYTEETLLARCSDLFDRIRAYAESARVPWYVVSTPFPDPDATVILPPGYYRGLVEAMPEGATEPPPEVAVEISRSQLAVGTPTVPVPSGDFDQDEDTSPLPK